MRDALRTGVALRSRVVVSCLASLLLAAPTAAQTVARPARAEMDPRVAARLDAETGRAVSLLLDDARQSRLPIEPLVDKALEGASKGAPRPVIVKAVRELSARLLEARQLLGPQAQDAEITAAAHALRGGLLPAVLLRLHERRGKTTLIAALGVYQELRGLRVTSDTATAAVVALQDANVTPEQIAEYQREVARDIAVGGQPAMVAAQNVDMVAGEGALGRANAITDELNATASSGSGVRPGDFGNSRRPKRKP